MSFELLLADYRSAHHAQAIAYLMDCYAQDVMGGGEPLPENVTAGLAEALANLPHAFSVLCYKGAEPIGLANCFEGFSTFRCKPLVNIHDFVVVEKYRGQGVAQLMLNKVEEVARAKGCCKLTLEVLEGNLGAQKAYSRFGFRGYQLDPRMGQALFWQKPLLSD